MKKIFLLLSILTMATFCRAQAVVSYGPEYDGYKLAKDSLQNFYLVNQYGVILIPVDSLHIDTDGIIEQIKNSGMRDNLLIVRVLSMHTEPSRTKELLFMTQTYNEIAMMVLKDSDIKMKTRFSSKQLEELKQKKE